MTYSQFLFAALLVGLFFTLGCGNSPATVSGTITLDGQILPDADISFRPTAADGTAAYGRTDAAGKYQLNTGTSAGLATGNYQVSVIASEIQTSSVPNADPIPKILTPAKYSDPSTSGLTADVIAGPNVFNFDLKSKP